MSLFRTVTALLTAALGLGAAPAKDNATLIRGARVFDGTGAQAQVADVLIRGDRIVAVGPKLSARGAKVIDARGLTLLPGLHDLHTHLRSRATGAPDDLGKSYAEHLVHGVTTVNDFSVSGEMLAPIRAMTGSGAVTAPNLKMAIRIAVPGGHGVEIGQGSFFTMEAQTPRAAELAMARALPYKPDVIKVFADGWRYGRVPDLNSMNVPTLAAIVAKAHAAGIPVITHTVSLEGAKVAAAAGVDALGHGIGDALVDDELIKLIKASNTGYVPTMVVYEPQQDRRLLPAELAGLPKSIRALEEERMRGEVEPIPELESRRWTILQENLRRLKAADVRIGVGTDAGIGGVYQGSSAIREIVWLTKLGHSPAEALAAATSVSAGILRAKDHGRIAPGQRADLLLTGGRPDQRIEDLYDVRRVLVAGREVALPRLRALLDSDAMTPLPVKRMTGAIDLGAGAPGRTDLDTLPVESHDQDTDHSRLFHVRQPGRVSMLAELGTAPEPYANYVLPLTRGAVQLADASGFTGVAFEARGAGAYTLLLDQYGVTQRAAFRAPFEASADRREIRIPFAAFRSSIGADARVDPSRLRAISFRLSGEPGARPWLELANVRFY